MKALNCFVKIRDSVQNQMQLWSQSIQTTEASQTSFQQIAVTGGGAGGGGPCWEAGKCPVKAHDQQSKRNNKGATPQARFNFETVEDFALKDPDLEGESCDRVPLFNQRN